MAWSAWWIRRPANSWSAPCHNEVPLPFEAVRYRPGEGVIGRILERNETWILPRVGDETRFLDRLGVYNPDLPFIGVPIRIGAEGGAVGVFAAQPTTGAEPARRLAPSSWKWSPT